MALKIKTSPSKGAGFKRAQQEVEKREQHRANFVIEKELFNKFKIKAMKGYTTPSALLRQWIEEYLEEEE